MPGVSVTGEAGFEIAADNAGALSTDTVTGPSSFFLFFSARADSGGVSPCRGRPFQ